MASLSNYSANSQYVVKVFSALFGSGVTGDLIASGDTILTAGTSTTLVDVLLNNSVVLNSFPLYGANITDTAFVGALLDNMTKGSGVDATTLTDWKAAVTAALPSYPSRAAAVATLIDAVTNYSGTDTSRIALKTVVDNRAEVGAYAAQNGATTFSTLSALQAQTASVDTTAASVTAAQTGATTGSTFTLTEGVDNFVGTAGNDTFNGLIGNQFSDPGNAGNVLLQKATFTGVDTIDGGAGTDKLAVTIQDGAVALNNAFSVKNVETIEVSSLGAATVNLTGGFAGATSLNIIKAVGAVNATAEATTDINVAMKAAGNTVEANGGKNVTVKLGDVAGKADVVTVGGTTAAKGDVVVEMTGAKADGATSPTLSAVTVNGGKTVTVTQKATSDASAAATDKTVGGHKMVQGAVTVNGNADTTTVTVKQDAAVAAKQAVDAVANKDTTYDITFKALAKGEKAVIADSAGNTLTFTASKALTAAEVASAFANLSKGAQQGSASAKLGEYTTNNANGLAKWFSGAVTTVDADNAKVTFSATGNEAVTLANTGSTAGKVTVGGVVAGTNKVDAVTGVLGVDNGKVVIEDSATNTVKTITVDGYANASTIGAVTATTALDTLTLKNAQGTASMTVADTAATLGLTVEKLGAAAVLNAKTGAVDTAQVNAVVTLTAAPTTLNVTSTGNNYIALTSNTNTTALNVSGTGLLDVSANDIDALQTVKVSGTAGLKLNAGVANTVTSVDTTGTTGTTTITIEGDRATYSGGAGVDNVTVKNANVAMTKAISLGAGDDKLTLNTVTGNIAAPTVTLDGGTGTNTIAMTFANAVEATKNGNLAAKIDNFQKLEITDKQTTAGTVNLANLDNINYVISNGSAAAAAAATKTTFTLDVAGSTATTGTAGDTVTFNTKTYTFTSAAASATAFATQLYSLILANQPNNGTTGWVVTGVSGTKLTFEAFDAGVKATPANTAFVFADGGDSTGAGVFATAEVSAGTAAGASVLTQTIDKLASGGTLELVGGSDGVIVQVTDAATGTADVLNIVANAVVTNAATPTDLGKVVANKVETINVEAKDTITGTDVSTNTLQIDGDKATTVNVKGAGNLTLTFTAESKALTLVDGSTATGNLNITSVKNDGENLVIKGGLGADTLTSAGQNDKLFGGDGKDTLKAAGTIALVELSGGAGIDSFDVSAANSKTAASVVRITDFEKGETIKFAADANASFLSAKFELTGGAGLSDYVGQAIAKAAEYAAAQNGGAHANGIAWFQQGGNTYIVQDKGVTVGAFDSQDVVVELTGLVDLSASSFNDNTAGTLLFI